MNFSERLLIYQLNKFFRPSITKHAHEGFHMRDKFLSESTRPNSCVAAFSLIGSKSVSQIERVAFCVAASKQLWATSGTPTALMERRVFAANWSNAPSRLCRNIQQNRHQEIGHTCLYFNNTNGGGRGRMDRSWESSLSECDYGAVAAVLCAWKWHLRLSMINERAENGNPARPHAQTARTTLYYYCV